MNVRRRNLSTIPAAGWRYWGRRAVVVFVVALAALGTVIGTLSSISTTGTSASPVPEGLFVSSQNPADVLALGKQLGITPSIMTVYADGSCYCNYTDPPSTSMTLMLGVERVIALRSHKHRTVVGSRWSKQRHHSSHVGAEPRSGRLVSYVEPTCFLGNPVHRHLPERRHDHAIRAWTSIPIHVESEWWHRQRSIRKNVGRYLAREQLCQPCRRRPIRLLGVFRQHPDGGCFRPIAGPTRRNPRVGIERVRRSLLHQRSSELGWQHR